jgi:hypothetical protein
LELEVKRTLLIFFRAAIRIEELEHTKLPAAIARLRGAHEYCRGLRSILSIPLGRLA